MEIYSLTAPLQDHCMKCDKLAEVSFNGFLVCPEHLGISLTKLAINHEGLTVIPRKEKTETEENTSDRAVATLAQNQNELTKELRETNKRLNEVVRTISEKTLAYQHQDYFRDYIETQEELLLALRVLKIAKIVEHFQDNVPEIIFRDSSRLWRRETDNGWTQWNVQI